MEQDVSSIPGSVGYISYTVFIEPTITWVPFGLSGHILLDTKIVLNKKRGKENPRKREGEGERPSGIGSLLGRKRL